MKGYVRKRLFLGFICMHILHHADIEPFYGSWMISELGRHGYNLSPGTLYPILHNLKKDGLLKQFEEKHSGKIRKYYEITEKGRDELVLAKNYLKELTNETIS